MLQYSRVILTKCEKWPNKNSPKQSPKQMPSGVLLL